MRNQDVIGLAVLVAPMFIASAAVVAGDGAEAGEPGTTHGTAILKRRDGRKRR